MTVLLPGGRGRRLRSTDGMRHLVRETRLAGTPLVAPVFVCNGRGIRRAVASLPDAVMVSVDRLVDEARVLREAGVAGVLLFGVADRKDDEGSEAWNPAAAVPRALRALRTQVPELTRWADVCLCAYTNHGHCGVLSTQANGSTEVDNDRTLPRLARVAVTYAEAGADIIAPSDMMDRRVGHLRSALDVKGHRQTAICSYAVKYASAFYGPFRDVVSSAPTIGDRRGYQMDPANTDEAVREALQDVHEGADLVMVKPAAAYLDVVHRVKQALAVPVVAFHVSGECALIRAAAERGWVDEDAVVTELVLAMRRAGADVVITYYAKRLAQQLLEYRHG